MPLGQTQPPRQLPDPALDEATSRYVRVFGLSRLPQYLEHRRRTNPHKPWFAFVGSSGAKYFTHFLKLEKAVKNPRSTTGSQKLIANAANDGVIF